MLPGCRPQGATLCPPVKAGIPWLRRGTAGYGVRLPGGPCDPWERTIAMRPAPGGRAGSIAVHCLSMVASQFSANRPPVSHCNKRIMTAPCPSRPPTRWGVLLNVFFVALRLRRDVTHTTQSRREDQSRYQPEITSLQRTFLLGKPVEMLIALWWIGTETLNLLPKAPEPRNRLNNNTPRRACNVFVRLSQSRHSTCAPIRR